MSFNVTYIEVESSIVKKTLYRLRDREGFTCLQETSRPNRFAVLAQKEISFLGEFTSQLIAPIDLRIHEDLSIGEANTEIGALFVVTHIDVIPPEKESGSALVAQMCIDSRSEDGCLTCNAYSQTNRTNHMTVIENWRDDEAQAAHAASTPIKTFRETIAPLSGALYDERFYTLVR
jgi:quinol monooxygenase YgiN